MAQSGTQTSGGVAESGRTRRGLAASVSNYESMPEPGRLEQTAVRVLAAAIAGILSLVAVALVLVPSHPSFAVQLASRPVTAVEGGAPQLLQPIPPTPVAAHPASRKLAAPRAKPARAHKAPISLVAIHVAQYRPLEQAGGYGCTAAIAYLSAHAAKEFSFVCPGYALGHQAMTCKNIPGQCPGQAVIVIAVPCPAAYKNEAFNSLLADGLVSGRIDPFGSCP
jgi:hypothetical protein